MTPICVLRSGGDFTPAHVQRLVKQVPGLTCLSDVEVPGVPVIPLQYGWPGWWSKLELFRPDIRGPLLFMDLDTTVLGPIDIFDVGVTTVLRDFTMPERIGSGFMYLTEADRAPVWEVFARDPQRYMRECATQQRWGDQGFLQGVMPAQRWQDLLPGRVVSYKVHCTGGVPPGARVVCFHGKPRPWEVSEIAALDTERIDVQPPTFYNNGDPLTKEPQVNLPRYFKDASGYCYAASDVLAKKPGLTPWDGAVDAAGFAVDAVQPSEPERPRKQSARRTKQAQAPAELDFGLPDSWPGDEG